MTTVAFLGLGAIGRPMAARLAAASDISLAVWNRTTERARAFAEATGRPPRRHAGRRGARRRRRHHLLPVSADVADVLDGADGLLAGLARGALLVDCTSGDPATSRRIAARLAEHGVGFLDAPVSGGTIGAEQGTLTVMVGGDEALLERARPVLEAFGKKIVHCGPSAPATR
jgi:3-hydroxyisobutyrate dehydrogenase